MFFSTTPPFLYYLTFLNHVHLLFNKKLYLKEMKIMFSYGFYVIPYITLLKGYRIYFLFAVFFLNLFNKSDEAVKEGNIKGI